MSHTRQEQMEAFGRFLDILDELRVKCPWDRKQTNESLRPNTIEETYELCDALMRDDKKEICKELGDVLLHVAFYAKIGSETGDFDIKDVCDKLCDKLIFRHPHVFGEVKADTAGQVSENWEQLKLKEKDGNKSVLSGVPAALPSLIKAYRIQDKARNVGFDWEEQRWMPFGMKQRKKDCNFLTGIKKQRLYSHRTEPPFYSNRASVHTNRTLCFLYFFFESSPLSLLRFIPFIISR